MAAQLVAIRWVAESQLSRLLLGLDADPHARGDRFERLCLWLLENGQASSFPGAVQDDVVIDARLDYGELAPGVMQYADVTFDFPGGRTILHLRLEVARGHWQAQPVRAASVRVDWAIPCCYAARFVGDPEELDGEMQHPTAVRLFDPAGRDDRRAGRSDCRRASAAVGSRLPRRTDNPNGCRD